MNEEKVYLGLMNIDGQWFEIMDCGGKIEFVKQNN